MCVKKMDLNNQIILQKVFFEMYTGLLKVYKEYIPLHIIMGY